MPWAEAVFRGADKVWVEVDEAGALLVKNGKARMRYKNAENAPVYSPFAGALEVGAIAPPPATKRVSPQGTAPVVAWTDGACTGNPGPAGAGALVRLADGRKVERHRALGMATNNVGELTAFELALELLDENGVAHDTRVDIHADSRYAIGVLSGEMKAKANRELIQRIQAKLRDWPNVRYVWVQGHAGDPGNERADALARRGVAESRK